MDDLARPAREPKAARERRTAALAGAVALSLAFPLLALALKRWKAVVPDQDEGFKPVAQISGRAVDTPRVTLEKPKPRVVLASLFSLPAPVPRAAPPPVPVAVKRAPPPKPRKKIVSRNKKIPARKKILAVAPPPFARPRDFYELEFPAAPAPPPRSPFALDPVAVPDFGPPPAEKESGARRPAVIIERVPDNDR